MTREEIIEYIENQYELAKTRFGYKYEPDDWYKRCAIIEEFLYVLLITIKAPKVE
jgi:hypothetical protein